MEEYIRDRGLYVNNLPRIVMWSGTARSPISKIHRVTTNLNNLEYSGISTNMENSENSQGIPCNPRENF